MKHFLLSLIILLGVTPAFSQFDDSIFLDNFSRKDFRDVSKDLGGAFAFSTNSGGASLGKLWGVELGLAFGVTEGDNIKRIAEENSGEEQDSLSFIPSGGLIAGVGLPFGIGIEANIIPELDFSDVTVSNYSFAARWEVTEMLPLVGSFSPLKLALRLSYGDANFQYKDNTESANFDIKNTEIAAIAGFNLMIAEPYISVSRVESSSNLDASSTNPLADSLGIGDVNYNADLTMTKLTAGVLFKLTFLRLGLEYVNFDTGVNRYTAKVSFKI